jgi:hypothetical protein
MPSIRGGIAIAVMLLGPLEANAYSVLTHEAIDDSL